MRPENTDPLRARQRLRRRRAVTGAALSLLANLAAVALYLWLWLEVKVTGFALGLVAALLAIQGIIIVGTLAALRQRLKEIKGGEEDAARQY